MEVQRLADRCEPDLRVAAVRGRISEVRIEAIDLAPLSVDALDRCGCSGSGTTAPSYFGWGVDDLGNIVFRIALDAAGRLTFTGDQAATERLLPRHGGIFGFADSEFFRIQFRRNAAHEVDEFLSHEPTRTYLAERDAASRGEGEP
jgi:hypothetical protein